MVWQLVGEGWDAAWPVISHVVAFLLAVAAVAVVAAGGRWWLDRSYHASVEADARRRQLPAASRTVTRGERIKVLEAWHERYAAGGITAADGSGEGDS